MSISLVLFILFCMLIFFVDSFINWFQQNLGIPPWLSYAAITAFILLLFQKLYYFLKQAENNRIIRMNNYAKEMERRTKAIQISNIDSMKGIEFEQYLQKLLINQGYNTTLTQISGDFGVDLIASKNEEKIAIQAKRYSSSVSRRAISDAVAGMQHYGCNKAMVITNSYFSSGAITLANSTACILVNRDTLINWIIEFQNSDS